MRQVLSEQGVVLGVKVIRKLAYRFADRARALQQAGHIPLNDDENFNGRRVVVSTDGGRVRLRENKRGQRQRKEEPVTKVNGVNQNF